MAANMFGPTIAPATPVGTVLANAAMNQQAQATSSQPKSNVIYVKGMQEVLNHPAGPNEHLYFPEKDLDPQTGMGVIWLRETDGKGEIKNPLKRLTYTMDEVAFGPEANFVTKQEFQKLYDEVSSMSGNISKLIEELGGTK